jgi:hypothetical protein
MEGIEPQELRGIGGWLLFFLLTFAVFTPIRSAIEAAVEVNAADADTVMWTWVFLGVYLIFTWAITGWFVLVRRWFSVLVMVAVLWLETVAGIVVLAFLPGVEGAADGGSPLVLQGLTALVYPTIWTAYLLKSVRVANTYPRNPTDADLPQVFE